MNSRDSREAHDAINRPRDWCRKEIEEATGHFRQAADVLLQGDSPLERILCRLRQ